MQYPVMPIVERRFAPVYGFLACLFLLFGTSMTVIGATLPRILEDFGWSYGTAGAVIAANAVGYFGSMYAAGRLVGRIGPRAAAVIGLSLVSGGLALFAASPGPALNLALYALIGIGQGFLEILVNWSVMRMDREGRAMSLMHAAFSIGAVAGPFVVGWLLAFDRPWTLVYRGMALLFGVLLAAGLALPFDRLGRETVSAKAGGRPSVRDRAYGLGFAVLFLYVGAELGISNWAAELFVRSFGRPEATGSFMVSLFWLGLLAGRLGIPLLLPRARQEKVLIVLSAGLTVSTILLAAAAFAGPPAALLGAVSVALAGLSCSSIYPIVMFLEGRAHPGAEGAAMGFAGAGGGLGAFLFPFLMSRIAGAAGVKVGFAFYALVAAAASASALALAAAARSGRPHPGAGSAEAAP